MQRRARARRVAAGLRTLHAPFAWFSERALAIHFRPMRIGEVLVSAGLISEQQLEEALRAQVMWGGRLGTCLVELGAVKLDDLSKALGSQHGLPAALGEHFSRADRELQNKMHPELAEKFQCLPLVRAGKRVVLATIAPLSEKSVALVAGQLDLNRAMIIQSIAAEMRIRFQLERLYSIPRDQRFMRSRGVTDQSQLFSLPVFKRAGAEDGPGIQSFPVTRTQAITLDPPLVLDTPALSDPAPPSPHDPGVERRTYLHTLADTLADTLSRHPDKDTVLARVHRVKPVDVSRPFAIGNTTLSKINLAVIPDSLNEALAAITLSQNRDDLARRVIGTVARFIPECLSALLLVVRGDAAVSWISFCRDGTELPALAVPLDHAGLVPAAMRRKVITRGASGDLGPIDYLLLASLGVQFGDLVVAPVQLLEHVIGMVVIAAPRSATVGCVNEITTATGDAFTRLMQNAA